MHEENQMPRWLDEYCRDRRRSLPEALADPQALFKRCAELDGFHVITEDEKPRFVVLRAEEFFEMIDDGRGGPR